jgi:hypothetical protein
MGLGSGTTVACTQTCSICSGYVDSTGAQKVGYCVCEAMTDGSRSYECASSAEWPPQR